MDKQADLEPAVQVRWRRPLYHARYVAAVSSTRAGRYYEYRAAMEVSQEPANRSGGQTLERDSPERDRELE